MKHALLTALAVSGAALTFVACSGDASTTPTSASATSTSGAGGAGSSTTATTSGDGGSGGSASGGSGSGGASAGGGGAGGSAGGGDTNERIVFSRRVTALGSTPQVFAMKPDGSEVVQLTTTNTPVVPTGSNDNAVISPDRAKILFTSGRDFPSKGAINPTLRMLYSMDPDGSNAARLTANPSQDCNEHGGQYSSDGAWIVFSMACNENFDPGNFGFERVYRIHSDGTGEEKLSPPDAQGNQTLPTFTADGSAVVYVDLGDGSSSELVSVDLQTHATTQLTHVTDAGRIVDGPALASPDGERIYFKTHRDTSNGGSEDARIESIAPDGSDPEVLFDIPALAMPAWYAGVAADSDFALSPDGTKLAFVSFLDPSASPATYTITTATLDGTNRVAIAPGSDSYRRPFWR